MCQRHIGYIRDGYICESGIPFRRQRRPQMRPALVANAGHAKRHTGTQATYTIGCEHTKHGHSTDHSGGRRRRRRRRRRGVYVRMYVRARVPKTITPCQLVGVS